MTHTYHEGAQMIDTDKMRSAYAATPLCQRAWTLKEGNSPTMLCAISAMVSFAGVQPDLIHKMAEVMGGSEWFSQFASPVLEAEYGMPYAVAAQIPVLFDTQENEWRGVQAVLDLCEQHNMDMLREEAMMEDAARFPQYGPATSDRRYAAWTSIGELAALVSNINHKAYAGTFTSWDTGWATTAKKAAPKKQAVEKPAPSLLLTGSTDFVTVGEKALDEYWKLSGNATPLWTANVMPDILAKFTPPKLLIYDEL